VQRGFRCTPDAGRHDGVKGFGPPVVVALAAAAPAPARAATYRHVRKRPQDAGERVLTYTDRLAYSAFAPYIFCEGQHVMSDAGYLNRPWPGLPFFSGHIYQVTDPASFFLPILAGQPAPQQGYEPWQGVEVRI
jgi:hypothetical protein